MIERLKEIIATYNFKRIGVCVTGGADSTILLYLLLSLKRHYNLQIYPISLQTIDKIHQLTYVEEVINFIQLSLNDTLEDLIVGEEVLSKYFWALSSHILFDIKQNYDLDVMFKGVTKNPPLNFVADEIYRPLERDGTNIKLLDGDYCNPFFDIDKKHIFKMYRDNNLQSLIEKTVSCSISYNDQKYFHCGTCWWCRERQWGLVCE